MRVIIVLVLLILIVAAWFYFKPDKSPLEPVSEVVVEEDIQVKPIERLPLKTEPEQIPAKPIVKEKPLLLDSSDSPVADLLGTQLLSWIVKDDLIRRFVITVSAMSEGNLPKELKLITQPIKPFAVNKTDNDNTFTASTASFQRFDALINVMIQLDPEVLNQFYRNNKSLFEEAFSELGIPGNFNDKLNTVIKSVIAFQGDNTDLLYTQSVVYKFKKTQLEKASDLDKFLWRLGQDNRNKIKKFLKEIKI